jgi:hypothetical protein
VNHSTAIQLRHRSGLLARLTLFLLVTTALLIIVPTLVGLFSVEQYGMSVKAVLWRAAVIWSPSVLYLYALWALQSGFRSVARGGLFGRAIARGCKRSGGALACGATLSAVAVPNILRILQNHGLTDRSLGGFTGVLAFDTAYLAVGVVGLGLILLGQLLSEAAELQSSAARLEHELGGFF